jgi:EmrB/QacA subfamily drug resistance transporter
MENTGQESRSYWISLFVVVLGAFSVMLNFSSINVALPKMMAIFGVQADQIQWVLTAAMLAGGVVMPVTGYLGDTLGTKKTYLVFLVIFTVGSIFCGMAWNNNSMIVARVIQAVGGGAIMPLSMAIIYRIVPRNIIGTALGFWGMAAVTAPAVGPTLGGFLVEINWRFLFTMNVPVGVFAVILGVVLLPESELKKGLKFDLWGFVTSALGCLSLLLALSQGQREGWGSLYIVFLLTLSFFMLTLFVLIELNSLQPMLDLRLFKNTVFSVSVFGGCLLQIGLFGGIFLIPIFAQNLMGKSAMETGLMLMPAALVSALMMPVSGALFDRTGPRLITFLGLVVMTWASWEFKNLSANSTVFYITILAAVRSVGLSLAMMPMATAGMNAVPPNEIGRASALNNVCRQISGSIGIALFTAVMQNRQTFHFTHINESILLGSPALSAAISKIGDLLGLAAGAGSRAGQEGAAAVIYGLAARESLVMAIDDTFIFSAALTAIALPAVFYLKKEKASPQPYN